jgi:hypothetical protein
MWLAAHSFGKSEAILRLPSMVCGLIYLTGSWKLSLTLFSRGWPSLVALVLLTSNPFLLDYLSAARGYGPAIAFFTWGSIAVLYRRYIPAGILLALSVLSNLTFLIPAACLVAADFLFSLRARDTVRPIFIRLLPAFLLTGLPGLSIPLLYAGTNTFYYGAETLSLSISTLTVPSFAYWSRTSPLWINWIDRLVLPAACLFLLVVTAHAVANRARQLALAGSTFVLCVITLILAHNLASLPYPWSRTGLYLIWLLLVSVLAAWAYGRASKIALIQWPSAVMSVLLAGIFVSQFSTAYYYDFRDDAPVSSFMSRLRERPALPMSCIGGSWRYDTTVNYYLLRYKIDWIEKMRRTDAPEPGCRFYILEAPHRHFVEDFHLTVLFADPESGAILAEAKP